MTCHDLHCISKGARLPNSCAQSFGDDCDGSSDKIEWLDFPLGSPGSPKFRASNLSSTVITPWEIIGNPWCHSHGKKFMALSMEEIIEKDGGCSSKPRSWWSRRLLWIKEELNPESFFGLPPVRKSIYGMFPWSKPSSELGSPGIPMTSWKAPYTWHAWTAMTWWVTWKLCSSHQISRPRDPLINSSNDRHIWNHNP